MKFYYVALNTNKKKIVLIENGRLAYFLNKNEAIYQCELLNEELKSWSSNEENYEQPYKVYCVESEPMEVTSD